jgi:apolipoprotein N-acyltransferase
MHMETDLERKPALAGRKRIRLCLFGSLSAGLALLELLLCFIGPMAFLQKPSLVVFPPFASALTEAQAAAAAELVERQIALTGSYSIVSRSFIEEYFVRTDPGFEGPRLQPADYLEAQAMARELGLQRYAITLIFASGPRWELSVYIRDVSTGDVLRSGRFVSDSFEHLMAGIGESGEPIDFRKPLSVETRGMAFTDLLVLALLGLQLVVGLLALAGREPEFLVELVWAPAAALFLFAYVYALSANMDYVQRYIASRGQLHLARSTALEQLHALLRYGPLLLLNGGYYVWWTLRRPAGSPGAERGGWLQRYVTRWSLPWTVLSATLFGLSFPSALRLEGSGWLAWFGLVPLLLVLLTARPLRGIFYGVVFGTLQALIINYWHGTYDYVSLHLIAIAFVAEYLLFMVPLVWLIKASGRWGFLAVPAAWVLFDYLRSVGVLGYPWGLAGTTQYRFLPLIQIASITGVWGVDFLVILANAALAWVLAGPAPGGGRSLSGKGPFLRLSGLSGLARRLLPAAVLALLFSASLIAGGVILSRVRARLYGDPQAPRAAVLLLQQNTDPRKQEYRENFEKLAALTDQALASLPAKPDLVAWPEGGFKLDVRYWSEPERKNSYWGGVVQQFLDYQRGLGTWLVSGTQDHEMAGTQGGETVRRDFNSSILLNADGQIGGFYHKVHLVPFSEYFPLDKRRFAGLYGVFQKYDISDWDLGRERVVFQHDKMRFATPICFEDVFPDDVRRFVLQGADLILNMSNDYWSLSPVEGRQHGILSLFRAVENQRPVLRSTSSGYTVYIDATGAIQPGSPAAYTEGYVVAEVPLPRAPLTLYTRWGDWFPWLCGAALAVLLLAAGARRLIARRLPG